MKKFPSFSPNTSDSFRNTFFVLLLFLRTPENMLRVFIFSVLLLGAEIISAQCINIFPYTENFETTNGNFTSGGTGNDWAWGTPSKAVISAAANGTKCWITGGLSTSFYTYGERSYLQTPCFDFSSLQYPFVSFNVFWETEKTYDGANFQYSTNGGTIWNNVGSVNDPTDCMNQNWFNSSNITYLTTLATVKEGWCGNMQPTVGSCQGGNGSGVWKPAKHCVSFLAGQPNVIFRFTFGAGTQCNNFDGFAVDDFSVAEAPANTANFTYACNGTSISFSGTTSQCPDVLHWNFGDGNTGTGLNTSHIYSTPGVYTATFSVSGVCNAPASFSQQVEFPNVTATSIPASCAGSNDGKAVAAVNSANGPFTFLWNTTPAQTTDTAVNLAPGNYTVTVSSINTCDGTATVVVNQGSGISVSAAAVPDTCTSSTGSATLILNSGTAPFSFMWSNGGTAPTVNGLATGNYSVTVTDANTCSASASVNVSQVFDLSINTSAADDTCGAGTGTATAHILSGTSPFTYLWSNGNISSSLYGLNAGNFSVTVNDIYNCSATSSASVGTTSGITISLYKEDVSCNETADGKIFTAASGGATPYHFIWSNNFTGDSLYHVPAGMFTVTVTDAANCSQSDSVVLSKESCPSYIHFPTAFSPNGDGANDLFKPKYSSDLGKYFIRIYNRWGELVYTSEDVNEGWDGFYQSTKQPMGVYVFVSEFTFSNSEKQSRAGNLTLVK